MDGIDREKTVGAARSPRRLRPRPSERARPLRIAACIAAAAGAAAFAPVRAGDLPAPAAAPCPRGVAAGSLCLTGRDFQGAYYWLVMPPAWNGTLVVHAHGGPELGPPKAERAAEDLARWSIWSRAGYAYAASGYRQGGVAVISAAEDTERVRLFFLAAFEPPKRTILHGQSWGAGVAAKAAELFGAPASGKPPYDGVLLTSGVLGGGTDSYNFRLDLRVVYQALCHNHPLPGEPQYPLWQGLPPGSKLTRAQLAERVDECTGLRLPAAERSAAQQRNLETLTHVVSIPERSLQSHLAWGTWHFQDIVFNRLGGRDPFGNIGVRYRGSADDGALNAAVARYAADPSARADFAADAGLGGRIAVPVLTMHAAHDPTAFVELESVFRERMQQGGSADHLVQVFTDDHEHSYLSDAEYLAAMAALEAWLGNGPKPTPQSVAARCPQAEARFDPATGCRFLPGYVPAAFAERVPPR